MDCPAWTILTGKIKDKLHRICPNASLLEVTNRQVSKLNFLKRISTSAICNKYLSNTRAEEAQHLWNDMFKQLLLAPKSNKDLWTEKKDMLMRKYGGKRFQNMSSHREIYWLWVDQIVPRPNPFRQRLTE
jgi:hypothetical protein